MSANNKQIRIFIDLDAAADSERTVSAAATLAAALSAELHGLFIVDESLIDLARLPFSVAIDPNRGTIQEVSPDTMQSAISRREQSSRRTLSAHAERLKVTWQFRSDRGRIVEQLEMVVTPDDYVVLPEPARMEGIAGLLRKLTDIPDTTRGVLLSGERRPLEADSPVIVLVADPESANQAVSIGIRVSEVMQAPLVFFVISGDSDSASRLNAQLTQLDLDSSRVTIHSFVPGSLDVLYSAIEQLAPRFVVASRDLSSTTSMEDIERLIRAAKAPICLLRSPNMTLINVAARAV